METHGRRYIKMKELEKRVEELEKLVEILSRAYLKNLEETDDVGFWSVQYKFENFLSIERGED